MLGFTSTGCFIVGAFFGFIAAAVLAVACVFYFNPDIKNRVVTQVEQYWGSIKSGVDGSIDAVKKAPVAEPSLSAPRSSPDTSSVIRQATPSRAASVPVPPSPGIPNQKK